MRYPNFWNCEGKANPSVFSKFCRISRGSQRGAGVAEQADAPDLKSGGVKPRAGSSPAPGTMKNLGKIGNF